MKKFDFVVIGSGPGGIRAAVQATKLGKKVALIESYPLLGGGCVHFGTLPSKSFRESVYRWSLGSRGMLGQELLEEGGEAKASTDEVVIPDMQRLIRRKDRVIQAEAELVLEMIQRNEIQLFAGTAAFVDPHRVRVTLNAGGEELLHADWIVIATGARPAASRYLPVDGKVVFDSNCVLDLPRVPESMVVLGAGIIGCEYASMFLMAGTEVFLIDKRDEILASVDREIVAQLGDFFENQGLKLYLNVEAKAMENREFIDKKGQKRPGVRVTLSSGVALDVECVLVAQGRQGNVEALQLEKAGLQADERGLIKVGPDYRTAQKHIFAVGDVIGFPALASTSMEQGRIAVCQAIGAQAMVPAVDYYPYGIYTIPEISTVGLSEAEVQAKGQKYWVGKALYWEVARGQIVGDRWGMLKLIAVEPDLKIVGVHIIGDSAADLIHIGQAVMTFGGSVYYFIQNVFNYPTLAEAYKTAAFNLVNQLPPERMHNCDPICPT